MYPGKTNLGGGGPTLTSSPGGCIVGEREPEFIAPGEEPSKASNIRTLPEKENSQNVENEELDLDLDMACIEEPFNVKLNGSRDRHDELLTNTKVLFENL